MDPVRPEPSLDDRVARLERPAAASPERAIHAVEDVARELLLKVVGSPHRAASERRHGSTRGLRLPRPPPRRDVQAEHRPAWPARGPRPRPAARNSTRTSSAPSWAAASLSATTIATGCPENTTSSRARGSVVRRSPARPAGRSSAVSTATTPGTSRGRLRRSRRERARVLPSTARARACRSPWT